MGQHKTNPIAIAAKNGELGPKPKRIGERDLDHLIMQKILLETKTGKLYKAMGINPYY